ncbi:hypothetical protein MBM_07918 [Drepanopeziza brunnea f. sp. 'multigermtubi' MB_m1]|uniref:Uncharacterized protein n=1 Tax=Marssonina brunnea f. sp. multigermtubi (strain MB_m1) TaxID=1072389 RepID=K1WN22_MARBU|nr:uncharacterized protein MBM_07918 [Drepanopeziza brunnea f. sp. 'multigermtubi' MB_m1]EKD13717.1 hypothetical protein MBM_07918 [Drepanopeziza brunnea f. sp. 'multigermtubi' MB_m1]
MFDPGYPADISNTAPPAQLQMLIHDATPLTTRLADRPTMHLYWSEQVAGLVLDVPVRGAQLPLYERT